MAHGGRYSLIVMRSNGSEGAPGALETLGTAVRTQRKALDVTQKQLAELAGVGVAFIYDLEHGKPTVRLDKVLDVFRALGLEFEVRQGGALIVAELPGMPESSE
jgi:HTH-type transcriptional regulator / antitoxin HipB